MADTFDIWANGLPVISAKSPNIDTKKFDIWSNNIPIIDLLPSDIPAPPAILRRRTTISFITSRKIS